MTVLLRYSCPLCGLVDVGCDVPARRDEPVITWLEASIRVLVADHKRRSPRCRPKALENLRLPLLRDAILLTHSPAELGS